MTCPYTAIKVERDGKTYTVRFADGEPWQVVVHPRGTSCDPHVRMIWYETQTPSARTRSIIAAAQAAGAVIEKERLD